MRLNKNKKLYTHVCNGILNITRMRVHANRMAGMHGWNNDLNSY